MDLLILHQSLLMLRYNTGFPVFSNKMYPLLVELGHLAISEKNLIPHD